MLKKTRYYIAAVVESADEDPDLAAAIESGASWFGDFFTAKFVREGDFFFIEYHGDPYLHLSQHYLGGRNIVKVEIFDEGDCSGRYFPLEGNYSREGAEAKVTHAEERWTVRVEAPTFALANDLRWRIFFRCVKPAE